VKKHDSIWVNIDKLTKTRHIPTSHDLKLYVRELLISTNMQDAKSYTPLSTSCDLTPMSNALSCDICESHRITSSLQYLFLTRRDVSFSVNKLSQYMQAPTKIHMKTGKRLLCYLKGTLDHGLRLSRATDLSHSIL